MEAKGLQQDEELKVAALRNKRKRASSSSSYLEPRIANGVDRTVNQIGRGSHSHDRDAKPRRDKRSQEILSSPSSKISLSQVNSSPAKLSRTYERKSRHKTKKDRYELKHSATHVQAPKEKITRRTKRPSRKEKTGSALLHNFAADNVASNRLTLKPGTSLGLFTKGRASSPYRRGGLPDLSFSEINFLRAHREKPPEPKRDSNNSKRRREHNAVDNDDEISRFFTVAKAPLIERELSSYLNNGYAIPLPPIHSPGGELYRYSAATNPTMTHVEAPIRPFLGFGERGPHPPVSSRPSSSYRASISPVKPPMRQRQSIPTSNFTWSTSLNYQRSTPQKKTVSDLFRSSPGKKDQESCRIRGSPALPAAESRKTVRRHRHIHPTAADASTLDSQRRSDHNDGEEIDRLHVHDQSDQSANSHNNGATTAEPSKMVPESESSDLVQKTPQATDLADSHLIRSNSPVNNEEKFTNDTCTKEQNSQSQFVTAVQVLLDQWKDKIDIPIAISNGLQESYTAPSLSTNITDQPGPLQPIPQIADIPPIADEHPQLTEDAVDQNESALSLTTIADNHCSVVPSKIVNPASVVSRGSATKSQYSWTDPRIARDRAFARSPFQDSTYSTCRGTGSLYEQQLPRSAAFSQRELLKIGTNKYLDFTSHFVSHDSMSQGFEPLDVPAHSLPMDGKIAPIFGPSRPGTPGKYGASVEQNWPSDFGLQHDSTPGLGPRGFTGNYEYFTTPPDFLAPHLSSAIFESRSIRGCTDNLRSVNNSTRGSQLNNEYSTIHNLQGGEMEELPVGFWKPNKLY